MITYHWQEYSAFEDAKMIRTLVFHEEQGFSLESEFDEQDKAALHIVVYLDGAPVGTGRIFSDVQGKIWHIGRVAILSQYRGLRLGAGMMAAMEQRARELGGEATVLSAQVQAKGFYASLGYLPQGEEYLDEHCPHIDMEKKL